ncbi:MAG TPA: type II toxin-antitoxin system RelE/ParE family toxin [Propionicimonas sp.]|nr:type II toxin-antitoxin system RelE/ParE family toxin [Propionicimonas sp.]
MPPVTPSRFYNLSVVLRWVWEVDVTLAQGWLLGHDEDDYALVIAALEILQSAGPMLGRPLVDTLVGSRHKDMKDLRPGSRGRSEVRILFAFDPRRRAILLVAGDKAGNWRRWYTKNIPVADDLFDDHLEKQRRRRTT